MIPSTSGIIPQSVFAGVCHARVGDGSLAYSITNEDIYETLRPRFSSMCLLDDVVFIDAVPKTSMGKFDKKVFRARFKDHVLLEREGRGASDLFSPTSARL